MANRYAVATGNWSNTATWDGGTLPGPGDTVRPNGFTVTINQDISVLELRNDASAPAAEGGKFLTTGTRIITADLRPWASAVILLQTADSSTTTVTGTIYGNANVWASGATRALVTGASSTVTINGNVSGGTTSTMLVGQGSTVTITGNLTGPTVGASSTVLTSQSSVVNVTGDVTAGSSSSSTTLTLALAVVATIVNEFSKQPKLTIEKVGVGAGKKDFAEQPNILRLILGTPAEEQRSTGTADIVWLMETNIDDVPAEILGYTSERLFQQGALDVFQIPIQMKKNRPGVLLCVIGEDEKRQDLERVIFEETGTLGIRRRRVERSKLERQSVQVSTPWGPVAGKVAWNNFVKVFTPEFEDCARLARAEGIPLRTVYETARQTFDFPEDADKRPLP